MNSVIETQMKHVTIRSFMPDAIENEMLESILEAGRRAPTSSNMQAYSIVVVRDPDKKNALAELAGGQQHIIDCPVFVAFCADLHRLNVACQMHGQEMTPNFETYTIATIDAALVGMSVQTAAESCGLGAVMIGAMRNDPQRAAELLGLPPQVYVVYGMCLGWPIEEKIPPQKPRLPQELVVHQEKYGTDSWTERIEEHDAELAEHYAALGRNLDAAAWSGVMAKILTRRNGRNNLPVLEKMGFGICSQTGREDG